MFGPVSGGRFSPVVSLVDASFEGIFCSDALAYIQRYGHRSRT
jgi:glycerol uptake facilitator-like aquaporin